MPRKPKTKKLLDGLSVSPSRSKYFDFPLARYVQKTKRRSVLLPRKNGRTENFYTKDSKLYFTQAELLKIQKGEKIWKLTKMLDGAARRDFRGIPRYKVSYVWDARDAYSQIKERYQDFSGFLVDWVKGQAWGISPVRMWNLSIVGAVIFGMFLMTMMYRYLGQGVMARTASEDSFAKMASVSQTSEINGGEAEDINDMIDTEYITQIIGDYQEENSKDEERIALEREIREMVKGYPIEKMAGEIAKKDRVTAAFLVAIAKKESNWGKRVPVYNGQDCLNYWGYRGIRKKMGTDGHTCFNSVKDAVDTVAGRIDFLVSNEKLNTPGKMVVWKCGYDCSWDDKKAVNKWISDVDMYFRKFNKDKK